MGLIKILLPITIGIVLWYVLLGKTGKDIIVRINDGQLRGAEFLDMLGGKFYGFQSIPYAKPPTGELRFKAPQPSGKWDGIRDGTKEIRKCIQKEFGRIFGEEDCLYLNVYTPEIPKRSGGKLKPVMVFIHGGAFLEGSASMKVYGPEYLITEDVVVVAINYRLGALGFMHLDGSDISPNNGLRDQVLALQWVQKNIASFGGNPNLVTIFGESAGGASVDLLTLSPLAKGLFHRAIVQSGSALADWTYGTKDSARPVAKYLGIESSDPLEIAGELRKVPCKDIFEAQLGTDWHIKIHAPWNGGLVVEGDGPDSFLPRDPRATIKSGEFARVPMMFGFTNREGIVIEILKYSELPLDAGRIRDIPFSASRGDKELIESIGTALNEEYFKTKVPGDVTEDVITMWSDLWINRIVVNSALLHAAHHDTYLYEFSGDTQLNYYKKLDPIAAKRPGASHIDDLGHLFRHHSAPEIKRGSVEDMVVRKMVKLWTNFAKYGKPVHHRDGLLMNVDWLPLESDELRFLNMTNEAFKFGIYDNERIGFLNSLFNYS